MLFFLYKKISRETLNGYDEKSFKKFSKDEFKKRKIKVD